jgi:hypothetical protein
VFANKLKSFASASLFTVKPFLRFKLKPHKFLENKQWTIH